MPQKAKGVEARHARAASIVSEWHDAFLASLRRNNALCRCREPQSRLLVVGLFKLRECGKCRRIVPPRSVTHRTDGPAPDDLNVHAQLDATEARVARLEALLLQIRSDPGGQQGPPDAPRLTLVSPSDP